MYKERCRLIFLTEVALKTQADKRMQKQAWNSKWDDIRYTEGVQSHRYHAVSYSYNQATAALHFVVDLQAGLWVERLYTTVPSVRGLDSQSDQPLFLLPGVGSRRNLANAFLIFKALDGRS